jgi:hypothetical protein
MFKQKRPFEVMRILLLTNAHSINTFALKCSQVLENSQQPCELSVCEIVLGLMLNFHLISEAR